LFFRRVATIEFAAINRRYATSHRALLAYRGLKSTATDQIIATRRRSDAANVPNVNFALMSSHNGKFMGRGDFLGKAIR
jgi:hypothetical protein